VRPRFERVALAGVGLIGGSLSLAARRAGLFGEVRGIGRNAAHLELARERGIVDSWTQDPAAAASGAELVVLAVPLRAMPALVQSMRPALAPGTLVTDVGSVKEYVHRTVEPLLPEAVQFVGGHPIAGTEATGAAAADPDLFRGRRCVLTRGPRATPAAVERIRALWQEVGMEVVELAPAEHDRILAWVSHLPHVLAFSAAAAVQHAAPEARSFAGPSFASLTRVAASGAETWTDIFLANADHLDAVIERFFATARELHERIRSGDARALRAWLEEARLPQPAGSASDPGKSQ
jgi:prephenate dehydrogenase